MEDFFTPTYLLLDLTLQDCENAISIHQFLSYVGPSSVESSTETAEEEDTEYVLLQLLDSYSKTDGVYVRTRKGVIKTVVSNVLARQLLDAPAQ